MASSIPLSVSHSVSASLSLSLFLLSQPCGGGKIWVISAISSLSHHGLWLVNFVWLCVLFLSLSPPTSQSSWGSLANFSPHISLSFSHAMTGKPDLMYVASLGPTDERQWISVIWGLGHPSHVTVSRHKHLPSDHTTSVFLWGTVILAHLIPYTHFIQYFTNGRDTLITCITQLLHITGVQVRSLFRYFWVFPRTLVKQMSFSHSRRHNTQRGKINSNQQQHQIQLHKSIETRCSIIWVITLKPINVHREMQQCHARHIVKTVKTHRKGLQCYEESPRGDPVMLQQEKLQPSKHTHCNSHFQLKLFGQKSILCDTLWHTSAVIERCLHSFILSVS